MPAFFVIHGHYNVKEVRGVVAEHCVTCAAITAHQVLDHFRRAHVYWIPLPFAKTHVTTFCICDDCKTSKEIERAAYEKTVPLKEHAQVGLGELIAITNEPLATLAMLTEGAESESAAETRLHELKELLLPMYKEPEGAALMQRLAEWSRLTPADREELTNEIGVTSARFELLARAEQFLLAMQKTIPMRLATLAAVVLGIGILLLGVAIGFVAGIGKNEDHMVIWCGSAGVLGLIAGIIAFYLISGKQRRAWYRAQLLPAAREAGIPSEVLLEALERFKITPSTSEAMKRLKGAKRELAAAIQDADG